METSSIMFFLGGVLAVGITIAILAHIIHNKIKKMSRKVNEFSQMAFGTDSLMEGFKKAELEAQQTPKSLSGMDTIVLPRIKKDFPDFNVDVAKNHIRTELKKYLATKQSVRIHNVVIRDYKKHKYESVIVMQAAAEYIENSVKKQKRYNFNYVYALAQSQLAEDSKITAVCPNCGGAIENTSLGHCEYCGVQLIDIIERNWVVKDIVES